MCIFTSGVDWSGDSRVLCCGFVARGARGVSGKSRSGLDGPWIMYVFILKVMLTILGRAFVLQLCVARCIAELRAGRVGDRTVRGYCVYLWFSNDLDDSWGERLDCSLSCAVLRRA